MDIQRVTWLLERTLYYTLLFLTAGAVIFSFSTDKHLAGLISLILMMGVIHKGFAHITIPAKSIVVCEGKVSLFVEKKSAHKRFDIFSKRCHVVTLPEYGVLDRPYHLEIFFMNGNQVASCLLNLKLGYNLELAALQNAYDSYVRHENLFAGEVKNQLLAAAAGVVISRIPDDGEEQQREFMMPIVAELNTGLASLGIEIKQSSCSFDTGATLSRVQII